MNKSELVTSTANISIDTKVNSDSKSNKVDSKDDFNLDVKSTATTKFLIEAEQAFRDGKIDLAEKNYIICSTCAN